jgi:hypothetical protein
MLLPACRASQHPLFDRLSLNSVVGWFVAVMWWVVVVVVVVVPVVSVLLLCYVAVGACLFV